MNTSFNRNRTQVLFESFFDSSTSTAWRNARLNTFAISILQANQIRQTLLEDAGDFYFKGTLSLCEAIFSLSNSLYSWATVKLYYSIFYFLRASLAIKGIALVRKERELFYLKSLPEQLCIRARDRTDHKGTIFTFQDIFSASDILQSNQINGCMAYIWLMHRREQVNYKEREFHDPNCSDCWLGIDSDVKDGKLDDWISSYIDDSSYIFCFQEDHACLALPLKRMLLTKQDLVREGTEPMFSQQQQILLRKLLTINGKEISKINEILF